MGFRGALVDRARRVVREPSAERVEGTTIFETVRGPWLRCRLQLDRAPDVDATPQPGYRRTPQNAQLLVGLRDLDGGPVGLRAADRIEVCSRQLGDYVFEATSEPEPIRRKRRLLGFQMSLTRVEEHEFREAEP